MSAEGFFFIRAVVYSLGGLFTMFVAGMIWNRYNNGLGKLMAVVLFCFGIRFLSTTVVLIFSRSAGLLDGVTALWIIFILNTVFRNLGLRLRLFSWGYRHGG